MRRRGKFKAAADNRAMQHRNDRHLAELDFLEGAMPQTGMGDALRDIAFLQFGQIEAGGEMLALTHEQHGADAIRQRS